MTKRQLQKIERKETAKTLVNTHKTARICNGCMVAITGAFTACAINMCSEFIIASVEAKREKRKAKKAAKSAHCADTCMGEEEV